MLSTTRLVLISSLAVAMSTGLFAQHGGGHGGGIGAQAPLPSSTAIGMGALSTAPSSTARSTLPALARPAYSYGHGGYSSGYSYGHGYSYSSRGYGYHGDYRRVPPVFFLSPYYYPFMDYSSAPYGGAPADSEYDPGMQANIMAENALGAQVQDLAAQVQQLQSSQPHFAYEPPQAPEPPTPPVTLVLRSGEELQVQNYAVMNQTFWDFSARPVRKIPLSEIDIPASTRKTQAAGGDFPQLDSTQ
jgi:hypothetical protein